MHAALRKVLGAHVQQKGSLVDAQRTRFDFRTTTGAGCQLREVEQLVNHEVAATAGLGEGDEYDRRHQGRRDGAVRREYGDEWRVVGMGEVLHRAAAAPTCAALETSDFQDRVESGVAAGIRRVEAVTRRGRPGHVQEQEARLARPPDWSRRSRWTRAEDRPAGRRREGAGERARAPEIESGVGPRATISRLRRPR